MVKIDIKDRKILYQLDLNCRQSNAQIGKKVGLHRNKVHYRIKRLEDKGVIKGYWTAINTFKLGYEVFRIYITFQDITSEIKNEIIHYFINAKNMWTVLSFKGEIDFDVVLWVNDIHEFYNYWKKTLEKFGTYFSTSTISIVANVEAYKNTYLLPEEKFESEKKFYETASCKETIKIDKMDFNIIHELSINARIPLIELSEKLKCSSQAVQYHIKKLIKKGIIQAFRVNIDISKLNLLKFLLSLFLKDHSQRKDILKFVTEKVYVEYNIECIGWSDMQFEIVVENIDHLMKLMEEISVQFPKAIRKQNFLIFEKIHKERWLPEL